MEEREIEIQSIRTIEKNNRHFSKNIGYFRENIGHFFKITDTSRV